MMKTNSTLLILDLDGTIVNSLDFIIKCFQDAVAPLLKQMPTGKSIVASFGPSENECIARVLRASEKENTTLNPIAEQDIESAAKRFHSQYRQGVENGAVHLFKGMKEVMEDAQQRDWPMAIFTGKGRASAIETLEQFDLLNAFGIITTSEDVPASKPAPDGIIQTMKQMNAQPSQTIMVGDHPADIQAAHCAGVTSIAALWGAFDKSATLAARPDHALETPNDLRLFLQQWKMG
ncbi:MAG: HAD family hydrolase [Planctomycetia bacterium]|nr:HAD family hydrolase [Planctomycetia bacterium]